MSRSKCTSINILLGYLPLLGYLFGQAKGLVRHLEFRKLAKESA